MSAALPANGRRKRSASGVNRAAVSAAIALIVATNVAWLARAGAAENSPPVNVFGVEAPPEPWLPPNLTIANEDIANPLVEAHVLEQIRYADLYYSHYHGPSAPFSAAAAHDLPSAIDAQGRPLWFDGGGSDQFLNSLIARLVNNQQFNDLERLFDDWSSPAERMADGRWRLDSFQRGIAARFSNPAERESGYELIQRWRNDHPFSGAAALAEAIYWYQYAWNARGPGAASTVIADGWKLFDERLAKAEQVLLECKPYASSSPLWGRLMIQVGLGLNWSKPKLVQTFEENTRTEKYFYSIYTATVWSLTPRWGGDWALVDAFIRDAVKNTQERDGFSMYARLYTYVDGCGCGGTNLFRDSPANWSDMKRGFDDLIQRYPHSGWTLNKYAAYACLAEDKETYQSLRFRIGKVLTPDAWPPNQSIDLCDHRFAADGL